MEIEFCTVDSFYHLFNEIYSKQEYYFETDTDRPFIIDCGSNIGMSVMYFKTLFPKAEILAFEPDSDAYRCLANNIRGNELVSVTAHKKAVTDHEGEIDFYYDDDSPGSLAMSTVFDRMPKNKRVVEAVCLSNYIDREVDFMKLDVEGAEEAVVNDLYNNNKLSAIKKMIIEYHHHIDSVKDNLSKILGMLEKTGFGYEIDTSIGIPFKGKRFQDILIYAYRKNN
jgi:FkbM family methyltransferase